MDLLGHARSKLTPLALIFISENAAQKSFFLPENAISEAFSISNDERGVYELQLSRLYHCVQCFKQFLMIYVTCTTHGLTKILAMLVAGRPVPSLRRLGALPSFLKGGLGRKQGRAGRLGAASSSRARHHQQAHPLPHHDHRPVPQGGCTMGPSLRK